MGEVARHVITWQQYNGKDDIKSPSYEPLHYYHFCHNLTAVFDICQHSVGGGGLSLRKFLNIVESL